MTNEIITQNQSDMFLPVMNIELALQRRKSLVGFVQQIMVDGHDFGKIPGAGDKPTLLKPGAEKLATFFGLTPVFIPVSVTEDWYGVDGNGEPFFYYRYKCELWRHGSLIATSEGSCNSHEKKYRYRQGERLCPECEKPAIRKDTKNAQGGWYCWAKIGGCGAQFRKGDTRIEEQDTGKILNPDVADQVNTIQKMSQKRALIAAVLLAVNASEFFTQDIEDMFDSSVVDAVVVTAPEQRQPVAIATPANGHAPESPPPADEQEPPQEANPFHDPNAGVLAQKSKQQAAMVEKAVYWRQLDNPSKPASEAQYGYLVSVVEAITGKGTHTKAFHAMFKRVIDGDNRPGRDAVQWLLDVLPDKVAQRGDDGKLVKNEAGKNVYVDNAKRDMVAVEAVKTLFQGLPA
jgi:hypothetical protein